MLECLILFSLLERDLTTYKIRKNIIENFQVFANPSLGAIHPSLKNLMNSKYVDAAKIMSDGGQKSMLHHITGEGRKYFTQSYTEITSSTIPKISLEIKVKIAMLPKIKNAETKQLFLDNASNALEMASYDIRNSMEHNSCGFYQTSAGLLYKEIADIKATIEKLKKESLD